MKMIQERERKHGEKFLLLYIWNDLPGAGFSFDCDKDGNVKQPMNPAAQANYDKCVSGEINVYFEGLITRPWSYVEPAVGQCACGANVSLANFTNTCDKCGRDYNMSGQLLAPREQWGEETGEHWSECY